MKRHLAIVAPMLLALAAGCSSGGDKHDESTSAGGPTRAAASTSRALTPATDSTDSATAAPTSSSTGSASSTPEPWDTDAVISSMAARNAPKAGEPRGGAVAAVTPKDGNATIENFLHAYFTVDTNIDSTDGAGGIRAARYVRGEYANILKAGWDASPEFLAAKPHHGYTTVATADAPVGQPSASDTYITKCQNVTVTWHGDAGWTPPKPTTHPWCVTATTDSDFSWAVTSLDDLGGAS